MFDKSYLNGIEDSNKQIQISFSNSWVLMFDFLIEYVWVYEVHIKSQ